MNVINKFFLVIYRILNIIYILVFLGLFIGLIIVFSFAKSNQITVKGNTVLVIQPKGELLEQRQARLFSSNLYNESYVRDIVKSVKMASSDNSIKGIIIDLSSFDGGSAASLAAVHRELKYFTDSDKFLLAYSSSFNKGGYILATAANEIWMDAMGDVVLDGLGIQTLYYKDAMERFGVKAYISRSGLFKGAVEPFLSNEMNEENKLILTSYLDDTWHWMLQTIALDRDIDINFLKNYPSNKLPLLSSVGGSTSDLALKSKLIDKIGSKYDFDQYVVNMISDKKSVLNYIDYQDYLNSSLAHSSKKRKGNEIAVIYATGTISNSTEVAGNINGEALATLITETSTNSKVAAIVLRVDTGGGDAYASELIYRAIIEAKREKPVIISMAGMAASGGYWFSLAADEIWAEEGTLTGSIGVFSVFFTITELMAKYGVTTNSVTTSSTFYNISPYHEPNSNFIELLNTATAHIYKTFLERVVSAGRAPSLEEAHKMAEGRIYSGRKAKQIGLIDEIGGLDKAVIRAAQLANISQYYESVYELTYSAFDLSVEKILQMNISSAKFRDFISSNLESLIPSSSTILALEPIKLMIR